MRMSIKRVEKLCFKDILSKKILKNCRKDALYRKVL